MVSNALPVQQRSSHDAAVRVVGRGQPVRRGWLFALVFWAYTVLAVMWLVIGLLPGALAIGDLSFRQMLAVAPDPSWLRNAWIGLYVASLQAEPAPALAMQYAFSFLNVALGVVLYRTRPGDWTARVLALGMVGTAAIFNYQAHSTLEMMGPLVTTVHEFLHVFSGSMYLIALLLFPDGKLPAWPGRRWRPPAIAGQVFGLLAIFGLLLFGYLLTWALHGEPASFVAFYGVVVPVVGISAQGMRYIAGSGQERQLSKTLILALTLSLAAALALGAGLWLASAGPLGLPGQTQDALERLAFVVFPLLFALLPLSLTAIVLRYRLWEIDLVINRSLVYGSLTAFIIAVYGLVVGGLGALQQQAAQTTTPGLAVQVLAPPDLPPLPAAVEVAAYRIVAEALANVVRHSQARRCAIWLCLDDALFVALDDDGVGLPSDLRAGVGLMSMRERAGELGGACRIERRPEGGTRVIARLPIDQAEAHRPGEPYTFRKD